MQTSDGKALTVENGSADDGANISLKELTGDKSQKFALYCNSDGSYTLLSAVSGSKSCTDVFEVSLLDGANICQWNYWGGDGQKFILEPIISQTETVMGDVNADGEFNISDAVMMQKWLLCAGGLTDWRAGDFDKNDIIDIFDLSLMKRMLIDK